MEERRSFAHSAGVLCRQASSLYDFRLLAYLRVGGDFSVKLLKFIKVVFSGLIYLYKFLFVVKSGTAKSLNLPIHVSRCTIPMLKKGVDSCTYSLSVVAMLHDAISQAFFVRS